MSATVAMELTAAQRQTMAQFIADYNGGDAGDYLDNNFALTRDRLAEFDGQNWVECGKIEADDDVGLPNIYARNVRVAKGQPRVNLWVIDFGAFRCCYTV